MFGVNGRPVIEIDEHIDVATFVSLKDEMDIGIARSEWELGTFGPSIYEKQLDTDQHFIEAAIESGEHPDAEHVKAVFEMLPTLKQRRRYLKLRYGFYNSSHSVYLRKSENNSFLLIGQPDKCAWTGQEQYFPGLVKWINGLPFAGVGRVIFFVNEHMCPVVSHSDLKHSRVNKGYVANHPHEYEFIWFRPALEDGKRFFIFDEQTGDKHYVSGHSCWFNSYDVHGADPSPVMNYSLRIDGPFTGEFRSKIGLRAKAAGKRGSRRRRGSVHCNIREGDELI